MADMTSTNPDSEAPHPQQMAIIIDPPVGNTPSQREAIQVAGSRFDKKDLEDLTSMFRHNLYGRGAQLLTQVGPAIAKAPVATIPAPDPEEAKWIKACDSHYLSAKTQAFCPFSLDYAKAYRVVEPKRTFVPMCCFFCHRPSELYPVYDQGIRIEGFEDHPCSQILYCDREHCKTSARISEQVYLAEQKVFFLNPKSPLVTSNIKVGRKGGEIESNWRLKLVRVSRSKGNIVCLVDRLEGGISKSVPLYDLCEWNLSKPKDIEPEFDEWYPPEVKASIMKLMSKVIKDITPKPWGQRTHCPGGMPVWPNRDENMPLYDDDKEPATSSAQASEPKPGTILNQGLPSAPDQEPKPGTILNQGLPSAPDQEPESGAIPNQETVIDSDQEPMITINP